MHCIYLIHMCVLRKFKPRWRYCLTVLMYKNLITQFFARGSNTAMKICFYMYKINMTEIMFWLSGLHVLYMLLLLLLLCILYVYCFYFFICYV